jgi:hypothetical protein
MKPTEEQLNDFINATMSEWENIALSRLVDALRKKKLVVTEALVRSLQAKLLRAAAGTLARSIISFDDYGRFRDIRVINRKKVPGPDAIEDFFIDWVRAHRSQFKTIPGYTNKNKIPTESAAIRRIAWGVAFGMKKKGITVGKAWYARTMAGNVHRLAEMLVTDYASIVSKSMAQQISTTK